MIWTGPCQIGRHSFWEEFDTYTSANMDLDIDTKRAATKASPFVVSLVSLSGWCLLNYDILFFSLFCIWPLVYVLSFHLHLCKYGLGHWYERSCFERFPICCPFCFRWRSTFIKLFHFNFFQYDCPSFPSLAPVIWQCSRLSTISSPCSNLGESLSKSFNDVLRWAKHLCKFKRHKMALKNLIKDLCLPLFGRSLSNLNRWLVR